MLFTRTLIFSTLSLLASAQTNTNNLVLPTSISDEQASEVVSDLQSYQSSLMAQPEYTSAVSVLATAIPASELMAIESDPTGYFASIVTATEGPTWYTALPTTYQAYFSSIGSVQQSILTQNLQGAAPAPTGSINSVQQSILIANFTGAAPAPTGMPAKVAGVVVGAGAVALAVL
ncbi:MAG: hypothetical protein Q9217_000746 [Psora testacea]